MAAASTDPAAPAAALLPHPIRSVRGQLGEAVEADGGKGGVALPRAAAEKMRPEIEILLHR